MTSGSAWTSLSMLYGMRDPNEAPSALAGTNVWDLVRLAGRRMRRAGITSQQELGHIASNARRQFDADRAGCSVDDGDPLPLSRYGIGDGLDSLVQFGFLGLGRVFFAVYFADDIEVALDVIISLGLED